MNNAIEQMLSRYEIGSAQKEIDALREIVQQVALAGLARAGKFGHSAKLMIHRRQGVVGMRALACIHPALARGYVVGMHGWLSPRVSPGARKC